MATIEGSWVERELTQAIPGYEIGKTLGRGGMGVVYKAIQLALKRPVALKMIRAELRIKPAQLARFRIEAEVLARLRHPNVVQIYEVGEFSGMPYFSLELVEGGTLAERLAGAPMAPRSAAELAVTLARTMGAVHRVGIVHRDLKPSNVLLQADGMPKVTDFGLAKQLEVEDGQTMSGQVMGTPSYMAPEQAQGKTHLIGPPADIYALGAILYEMLTGRPPFKGPSSMETLALVVVEEPLPPSRLQPRVPRDLETICLKCLAKEPARRYDTADALADDLERFLAGTPIRARRTPAWERAAKWARRRPATAALVAFGLAVTIGLAVAGERYSADTRRREAGRVQLQLEAMNDLNLALRQRSSGAFDAAKLTLTTLKTKLRAEPLLADLSRRAVDELRAVDEHLAVASDYARFRKLRDQALLFDGHALIFPETFFHDGDDEASSDAPRPDPPAAQIRRTAAAALEVFPLGSGAAPDPLPRALSAGERAEVEADRYLMLLVQADAVARTLPGEDPKRQANEALHLLDRAAALRAPTSTYHLRRAACLKRLGDGAGAELERRRAERIAPTDAFDYLLLGWEDFHRGDLVKARAHLDAALRLRHESFWAHCLLAVAELNSVPPRAAEAKTELTTCLAQEPSYAWLHLLRGSAYGQMGVALASAGRKPRAAALAAEAQDRFDDAEADFAEALKAGLEPGLDYVLLMNRGVMRFQRGKWDLAAADFSAAIALDPARYNAYASLGQALRKLGRKDEAIAHLDEAIAREPKKAALYRVRALARLDGGPGNLPPDVVEAALGDLETSARLETPGSRDMAEDLARRGRLLLGLDRPGDALASADAALTIAPDSSSAHLVKLAALLALERYADVIDSCDTALAHGPASAELYRLRGLARSKRDDFSAAIEDYTLALTLHPDDPAGIHGDRGWAHLLAGAPEIALNDFETVLRLDAANPEGYAGRAAARIRLNRVRDALADAEKSLRRKEPTPRLLYLAARTYTQASVRTLAAVARSGRTATRDSLAYEARAADLLALALARTPGSRRPAFWRRLHRPRRPASPALA